MDLADPEGTQIYTQEKIEEAKTGVLVVDEAYRLAGGGEKDFGKEAIESLMGAMNEPPGKAPVMVFAGVSAAAPFASSPGEASRSGCTGCPHTSAPCTATGACGCSPARPPAAHVFFTGAPVHR